MAPSLVVKKTQLRRLLAKHGVRDSKLYPYVDAALMALARKLVKGGLARAHRAKRPTIMERDMRVAAARAGYEVY